ncbi:MAG: NAD(P)H-dependent oxidoreductase [Candidatus Daviesbacteria bacterium]|nr:NAD(P)H-dependent oxidoreductase [Candidatus Daviesbacteria bacterium]
MVKIQIILGSTRQKRFSEKPGKWIFELLQRREGIEAELIDLRDYPLPFFDEPISPAMSKGEYSNKEAERWAEKVAEANGYIIVTPEYNHGYSAVLKNALDYVYSQWNNKPVGFVAYGGMGGARAVEQLREVAMELQMVPIRAAVHIPAFWTLLDDKGNLKTETLNESAEAMLDQLIWWTKVLKEAREKL